MKNSQIGAKTDEKHAYVPHMPSHAVCVVSMHTTMHKGSRVGRRRVTTSAPTSVAITTNFLIVTRDNH